MIYKYNEFLKSKKLVVPESGIKSEDFSINDVLFPFQQSLVKWAVRKGRCALFADTGLGKTLMQIEWARIVSETSLIIAPLSVVYQTIEQAKMLGLTLHLIRSGAKVKQGEINITNYDSIQHVDFDLVDSVVLDESSILKSIDGKTKTLLIESCKNVRHRLCCTATPAPNDITEISNHCEFLGIMTRPEMLAMFYVHDENGYRLKRHATSSFYQWLASWSMFIKHPSNIGFDSQGYDLPPINVVSHLIKVDDTGLRSDDELFFRSLSGISGRTKTRSSTIAVRIEQAKKLTEASCEQWIIWCGLNDESRQLKQALSDSEEIIGSDAAEMKIEKLKRFTSGQTKILITKTKISGFGMNLQNCHNMMFFGLSDSWEAYYQAVRRCYRFGQTQKVNVHILISDIEREILDNVLHKEQEAVKLTDNMIALMMDFERKELTKMEEKKTYDSNCVSSDNFTLINGDSAEELKKLPEDSVDLSIFSPPFASLYTYSPTERDLGNCKNTPEFFNHFGFITSELLRVTKPGRNCCVHVAQVPAMLCKDGYIGLKDFRGQTIAHFIEQGWIYYGEVCIDKDPQAQAIRTKSKSLLFVQFKKDSIHSRPALADYILIFKKPGENKVPIHQDLSNETWIEWARPIWYGIRESDTLQYTTARDPEDERHLCPLQLETIKRCVMLYSNVGETVLSPFAGIGSEGFVSIKNGRKFIGIELKPSYARIAEQNLVEAESSMKEDSLWT